MSWQKAIILNPNEQVLHSWEGNCERHHKAVVKAFIGHKTEEAKETNSGTLVLTAVFIIITLLVLTVFPVGFVFAQSGYWDVTTTSNATCTVNESGASITVSMSGNSVLHLTVTGQQVSGSGNGNYAVSMSGSINTAGSYGTISAPQVNIAETDSVSGTVGSDMIATLIVTVTTTNAPSTLSGTITTTVEGQTVTTPINVPISSITQTTSGTYQVKLQDGYTVTSPISGSGVQGSTSISVTRRVNPSPTETSPTPSVSSTPESTPTISATPSPTETYTWGTVGLLRGSAAIMDPNTGVNKPITSQTQIDPGTEVQTGNNAIVEFSYPDQGGTVYLGENSDLGVVALQSHPAPDGQITFVVLPSKPTTFNWGEEGKEMLLGIPIGVAIAVGLFGEPFLAALLTEIAIHGGVLLLRYGSLYIKETPQENPQLVRVPQGLIVPEKTEYVVNVSDATTVVQVIDGPVVFIDPVTNNTITVETNQMLTLPSGEQGGFTSQELQNYVSNWDSGSVNQWWAISNPAGQFPWLTVFVPAAIVAAIAILTAVLVLRRRRKTQVQQMPIPPPPPPPPF